MRAVRAMLVVNPASGRGAAARVTGGVSRRLREKIANLEVHVATDAADTSAAARRAVDDGYDVLAVLGGDGSVHLALQACAGSDTALAVIPSGTGNDLAAALGMPAEPLAAAGTVASTVAGNAQRRDPYPMLDLGRIEDGPWFATVLCAGFDSMVNERANRMRWPRGPRRYDLAIFVELARLGTGALVLETEHGTQELQATMVSVGNTPSYGGGLRICPAADLHDGMFDVTLVGPISRRRLVRTFPLLRTGAHVEEPEVTTLRAKRVVLGGDNGWVAYADGDRQRQLPLAVTCEPAALRVVTAAPSPPPDAI